jgi:hypothetical protein
MIRPGKILVFLSTIIFVIAFLIPSRLVNYGILLYLKDPIKLWIGQVTTLLAFILAIVLFLFNKRNAAFVISCCYLFMNNNLFHKTIRFLFSDEHFWPDGLIGYIIPLFFIIIIGILLLRRSFKTKSMFWYFTFIVYLIVFYFIANDRNCMVYFVSDEGILTYQFSVWFKNCGSYYAWDMAGILLNIGLFLEMYRRKKLQIKDAKF